MNGFTTAGSALERACMQHSFVANSGSPCWQFTECACPVQRNKDVPSPQQQSRSRACVVVDSFENFCGIAIHARYEGINWIVAERCPREGQSTDAAARQHVHNFASPINISTVSIRSLYYVSNGKTQWAF